MKTTEFGELIYNENDIVDLIMQGRSMDDVKSALLVDDSVNLAGIPDKFLDKLQSYKDCNITVQDWDLQNQSQWNMPEQYKSLDIAEWILNQCTSEAELQRCGKELLLFQNKNLFSLLCYLKYLVDTMREHGIIWGVGRGSSVASYVLYKIGVHRIDSMYYDLDIEEFLR